MKIELDIDTKELAQEIAQEVIKAIRPILMKNKAEDDKLFTVDSLSEYLEVSKGWVYERTHLKEIPYMKVGRFPRFRKRDIDKWLDSLKTPSLGPLSRSLKGRR